MDIHFFLSNLWRWKCDLPETVSTKMPSLDQLSSSEWNDEFEGLMRNRLIMGAIRYGRMRSTNKPQYDRIESMIKRLKKYQLCGNQEFLVDVANLALLEYTEGEHPNKHWGPVDDGEHVTISKI